MLMLAVCLQGKYVEADPLYLRAIEIRDLVLGADSDLAVLLGTRGRLLAAQVCVCVCSYHLFWPQSLHSSVLC